VPKSLSEAAALVVNGNSGSKRRRRDEYLMSTNSRHCTWVLAVAMGVGISGGAAHAVAAPFVQDKNEGQDYSKNKRY